jgi:hypothetical protein
MKNLGGGEGHNCNAWILTPFTITENNVPPTDLGDHFEVIASVVGKTKT